MKLDSSDHMFDEVDIPGGRVRVTRIERGWAEMPSLRVQIRDENGHLRQGPEIPISVIDSVVGAIFRLAIFDEKARGDHIE